MKRRFRYFTRAGWYVAEVPRTNLYKLDAGEDDWGNVKHYREICEWCDKTFKPGTWESKLHAEQGSSKPGIKRFAFQHNADRTMFVLRWS